MNDLDKENFEQMVRATAEMYSTVKKVDVTPILLKLFFASLSKFTIEQVSYGFEQHLSDPIDGKFFPKPANVIKHLQVKEISAEDKGMLAWNQIMLEMRRHGAYDPLELDDKQALAAIAAVHSWKDLCGMPEKDLTWVKKEFLANYVLYENTPLELLPSSLPGLVQLQEHKTQQNKDYGRITDGIKAYRLKNKDV